MKDSSAEEIISRKVRMEEAQGGFPERGEILWSQLDKRLEQKKTVPGVRYYTLRAAAAVLILFILGLCLYPARNANTVQTAAIQTGEQNTPVVPGDQDVVQQHLPDTMAATVPQKKMLTHKNKKHLYHEQHKKVNRPEEEREVTNEYAGLYAMPQPVCADISADQYQPCFQTL